MSLIKLINNKNVLQKINLTRLFHPHLKNHSNLPPYTLLENSPALKHRPYGSTDTTASSDVPEKVLSSEYSSVDECLRYLFGGHIKKKGADVSSVGQPSVAVHNGPAKGGMRHKRTSKIAAKPLPRLLYIQNPMVWLTNKLDFRYLKNWDPHFSESEFSRGARQAVSTITELLSKNMFDALKPLLTKSALLSLRKDVEILWADEVRRNIGLSPGDVQLIIPRKLHFKNVSDKKYCDIDVVFIALKWLEGRGINPNPPLVFIDIIARFHRNYTEGMTPDWIISAFKLRRFNIVPQKT